MANLPKYRTASVKLTKRPEPPSAMAIDSERLSHSGEDAFLPQPRGKGHPKTNSETEKLQLFVPRYHLGRKSVVARVLIIVMAQTPTTGRKGQGQLYRSGTKKIIRCRSLRRYNYLAV